MIYGVGINDIKSGSQIDKKIYNTWENMLKRCYSKKYQLKQPTYIGMEVCDEWKYYSNFKEWYLQNYKEGYALDKDISYYSKIYSPQTCAFVPVEINNSILESTNINSSTPLGVSIFTQKEYPLRKPYFSRIKHFGKQQYLGTFETPEEAHKAWQIAKKDYFIALIKKYSNVVEQKVIDGLQKRVDILDNDIKNGTITVTLNKI